MNNRRLIMLSLILVIVSIFVFGPTINKPEAQPDTAFIEIGNEIAGVTFSALGKKVKTAIAKNGITEAVKYCNLEALSTTDSLSQAYGVKIKRTSSKLRNPKNIPTVDEMEMLKFYENNFDKGIPLKPFINRKGDEVQYIAPISTIEFCLQCHGVEGEKMNKKDYQTIRSLYPNDTAINYQAGDFRGMWSITFNGNK